MVLIGMVYGIAVCVLFGGASALCQGVDPIPTVDTPKVAGNIPVAAEHPLMPVIRWAERERPAIAAFQDYTATMQKQENVGGEIQEAQVMEIKVRHQPFSVYIKFLMPQKVRGQQAIYVKGRNNDKLVAHGVGLQRALGTHKLDPTGIIAMAGNKYPITDMGILNLIDKLLEVGYRDAKYSECTVDYVEGVKLSGRECTVIQVVHPEPRPYFVFHIARIFVDKELNVPIRYESYDWPRKAGDTPKLLEVYTYQNLNINVGLTDADFDQTNPVYNFPRAK